jgi:DNA-binding SARP family transcriptional activator
VAKEEWERAYELYKRVGSVDAQLKLIQRAGPTLMARGRFLTLSEWLENIRSDELLPHPELISLKGAVLTVRGDPAAGLTQLNRAVNLQREKKDDSLALSLERRSTTYRLLGKLNNALMDAEEALALTEDQPNISQVRADALLSKGLTLFEMGKRNEAIPLFNEALEAYQLLGDEETAAKVRMETGRMLKAAGKYEAATEAYQKALDHFQVTHNLAWQANLYNNLGVLQGIKGDYVAAASSLEKAIQYARLGAYPRLEAYAITSMGDLYRDLDSLSEAQEAYRQARPIAQRINERLLLFYLNLAEARTALLQNRKTVAQELLRAAEAMAMEDESEYERYACALEQGALHCSTRAFRQAVDQLAVAVEFFDREAQQVEAVRAHLLLGAALDRMEEHEQADEHFHLLENLLNDAEKIHLLIMPAREIRGLLEQSPNPWTAELLEKVADFESQSSMVRRMLRRQTLAVPLGPPSLVVRTLGKTQVKVGDHIVTSAEWQSQTARDFFFLILNHPEGLSKEEVGVTFWPDSTPAELKQRFKNTIYRLRHAVGKDVVLFDEDYYRFNRAVDYELDCEAFEKELSLAQSLADEEEKLAHFHSAAKIYRGSFLPDMDAYWVITERDRLQNRYVDAMIKMGQLHLERGEMLETLSACRKILEDDQCQEAAHRLAMQAHAAMGNRAGVIRQYEQCRDALDKEYGAAPSGQTQKLYEALMK